MNLSLTPGETGDWKVVVRDATGALKPLDDLSEAWFTIKTQEDGNDPGVAQVKFTTGGITKLAGTGEARIVLPSASSAALADSTDYRWDFRVKFVDGTVSNPKTLSGLLSTGRRVTYSV